ncbi:MAG: 2-amino-4-hydroxy-6-hydroxymethyldihydropteridine diphosphokinase [Anaerolineales bacterium]|nr:2-amino-4-hydroxy-6-hydroxymethyldihydropteridine diphosphokinase [Anaerolineales bacterium]
MCKTIYLALGANQGDRYYFLVQGLREMSQKVDISCLSSIYETPPWGYKDQSEFLNMALVGVTKLSPEELLDFAKDIEQRVGRTRSFRYGPREIDIDILFYEDEIIESDTLSIPHSRIQDRAFVLVPLAEINPELVHPITGKTILKMLEDVDTSGIQKYLDRGEIDFRD